MSLKQCVCESEKIIVSKTREMERVRKCHEKDSKRTKERGEEADPEMRNNSSTEKNSVFATKKNITFTAPHQKHNKNIVDSSTKGAHFTLSND